MLLPLGAGLLLSFTLNPAQSSSEVQKARALANGRVAVSNAHAKAAPEILLAESADHGVDLLVVGMVCPPHHATELAAARPVDAASAQHFGAFFATASAALSAATPSTAATGAATAAAHGRLPPRRAALAINAHNAIRQRHAKPPT